jgi:hypothetical protein
VEFGLVMPVFLVLLVGILELGSYINQLNMLEKALRAGAMYAARTNDLESGSSLSSGTVTATEYMVANGDPSGSNNFILGGWNDCVSIGDCLTITVNSRDGDEGGTSITINVIKLFAQVPYDPVLEGGLSLIGLGDLTLEAAHEQAWIGS